MVQFGVFDWVDFSDEEPPTRLFDERLALVARAEQLGFARYHVAEHHFTPLGGAPSPSVWLAAVARSTSTIRLGPLVYLLPLYHPLRLIGEIAMLDHLSHGRLDLGVGRGVSPWELGYYGVDYDDSRELFEETLEVVLRGLANPTLSHRGRRLADLDRVPIELRPVQAPYPPLWYASTSPEGIEWAATHGCHLMGLGPAAAFGASVARYHELRQAAAGRPGRYNGHVPEPTVGMMRQVILADSDAEAERIAERVFPRFQRSFVKLWIANGDQPRVNGIPTIEKFRAGGALVIGTPDTVRAALAADIDQGGLDYLALAFSWGAITAAEAERSMELFASEVMAALA